MSLEAAIEKLTVAVEANTAAHLNLAEVAKAAATGSKTVAKAEEKTDEKSDDSEDDAEAKAAAEKKAAAAEKRKANAAAKKAKEEAEAKAKEEAEAEDEGDDLLGDDDGDDAGEEEADLPEVTAEASKEDTLAAAKAFLGVEDEEKRDARKADIQAAFAHLGVTKLGGITDDEDRGKLVTYIAYWTAGVKVDFKAVDERIAEA